jgi:FKBP-type peptidyl-prolyl cis-trans isomerase SlyD
MALRIEPGRIVRIAYRIVDSNNRLLEEFTPEKPYEYRHGEGQIVGPIERALLGKTAGFRAEVPVTPRDGYGDYDPSLVGDWPRSRFPNSSQIKVGMKFNTIGPDSRQITIRVIDVDDDKVSVDGNHPLAGLDLVFVIQVLEVREGEEPSQESETVDGNGSIVH